MANYNTVIGITFGNQSDNETDFEYINAVKKACNNINSSNSNGNKINGNKITNIEVRELRPNLPINFTEIDGILLSGGLDVNPRFYGEEIRYDSVKCDEPRDEFELDIIKKSLELNTPVLGICRGIQILNVAFGGTLYQDISNDIQRPPESATILNDSPFSENASLFNNSMLIENTTPLENAHKNYHAYTSREEKRKLMHKLKIIDPESRLGKIIAAKSITVNSRHHQAIKDIAPGFNIVSVSYDGIIEAIESNPHKWVVGVQWHPEAIEVYENFKILFEAFIFEALKSHKNRLVQPKTITKTKTTPDDGPDDGIDN